MGFFRFMFKGAAGAFILVGSLVVLAIPAFAHTGGASFDEEACSPGGWTVELTVTATNPELHPKATIDTQMSPISGANVPFWYRFNVPAEQADFTVSVVVTWSDGFTKDLGSLTAHRPEGCVVPPPTSTPPTTTCDQANPPRDCTGATTTSPPFTTTPATTLTPTPPTAVVVQDSTTVAAAVPSVPKPPVSGPPRTAVSALPTTGSGMPPWVVWAAAAAAVAGSVMFLRTRRV